MLRFGHFILRSGDRITCTIQGVKIDDAKIFFRDDPSEGRDVSVWICHNNPHVCGDRSPDKLGYIHSWQFYYSEARNTSSEVRDMKPLIFLDTEIKKEIIIQPDLSRFLKIAKLNNIQFLFHYKYGIFDEFSEYDITGVDGCVSLKNDKKSVEIKLSRFIRQLSTRHDELIEKDGRPGLEKINISDAIIERIHNDYVSYQKMGIYSVKFLSGEDIFTAYNTKNYIKDTGTISKSCMVNRPEYIQLYIQNPNQVQLAVIYIDDRVAARCLVWKDVEGKFYSDRVYYQQDWLEVFLRDKLIQLNIEPIDRQGIKTIKLEKWTFEKYPYADSFYNFDMENGELVYFNSNKFKQLRRTDGQIG